MFLSVSAVKELYTWAIGRLMIELSDVWLSSVVNRALDLQRICHEFCLCSQTTIVGKLFTGYNGLVVSHLAVVWEPWFESRRHQWRSSQQPLLYAVVSMAAAPVCIVYVILAFNSLWNSKMITLFQAK